MYLIFGGRYTAADALIQMLEAAASEPAGLEPQAAGQYQQARAIRAHTRGDIGAALSGFTAASAALLAACVDSRARRTSFGMRLGCLARYASDAFMLGVPSGLARSITSPGVTPTRSLIARTADHCTPRLSQTRATAAVSMSTATNPSRTRR